MHCIQVTATKNGSQTGIITITTNNPQNCCYIAAKISEALQTLGEIADVLVLPQKKV